VVEVVEIVIVVAIEIPYYLLMMSNFFFFLRPKNRFAAFISLSMYFLLKNE